MICKLQKNLRLQACLPFFTSYGDLLGDVALRFYIVSNCFKPESAHRQLPVLLLHPAAWCCCREQLFVGATPRESGVRFDRQEGQQWIQSLVLAPPDEALAASELAVQASLVGGGQALREASSLHQGSQDSGEERPASHGQEGRYQPGGLLARSPLVITLELVTNTGQWKPISVNLDVVSLAGIFHKPLSAGSSDLTGLTPLGCCSQNWPTF